jgi:hypothetical protein
MAELEVGDAIPELRVTPDAGLTKRYAEASGDPNPIHTDEEFAKSVGLPGCILHGLYNRHGQGGRRRPHRHRDRGRAGREQADPQRGGGGAALGDAIPMRTRRS